jgi:shikimate dehydrogenase
MRKLLAVLGRDVSRSLSPFLHEAAARACDLDVAYVPISCADPAAFRRAVEALRALGSVGCNVTIPYKADALALADHASTTAREIGAVNTLTFSQAERAASRRRAKSGGPALPDRDPMNSDAGPIHGDNTDGPGLARVLESLPPGSTRCVHILGAGGAARAAAWAVVRAGAAEIHVSARNGAGAIAEACGGYAHGLARVKGATLVVSALPADRALAAEVMSSCVDPPSRPYVLDLAYGDLDGESYLTLAARAAGLPSSDGRAMLVEQAALSLSLWTGGEVSRIRAAMRGAIRLDPRG